MGNKLGRKRQLVDEKYTRPQGLYTHKDVDHKKLRKLILESKLAPCYPGDDECTCDLEECPICFLYYPTLNRSRCCMKSICTECFLQMKVPNSTRPTQYGVQYAGPYPEDKKKMSQCPFCKTTNYAVEYRGVKTKEEKGLEQIEEQRVIEAKIRIRQKELQDDEEKDQKRSEYSSTSGNMAPVDVEYSSTAAPVEYDEVLCFQDSCASPVRPPPPPPHHRDDEFDLDLEDIMIMEAIWLSIQEKGRHKSPPYNDVAPDDRYATKSRYKCPTTVQLAGSLTSPSGGLACAIAALAEHQQTGGESSTNFSIGDSSSFNLLQSGGSRFYGRMSSGDENYRLAQSSIDALPGSSMTLTRTDGEWNVDRRSDVAEAGTSYAGSDGLEDTGAIMAALPVPDELDGNTRTTTEAIVPESFEEQMMLAMAVSLAEARTMTGASGVSWQ